MYVWMVAECVWVGRASIFHLQTSTSYTSKWEKTSRKPDRAQRFSRKNRFIQRSQTIPLYSHLMLSPTSYTTSYFKLLSCSLDCAQASTIQSTLKIRFQMQIMDRILHCYSPKIYMKNALSLGEEEKISFWRLSFISIPTKFIGY